MHISIDQKKCHACGACVTVCPSKVFKKEDGKIEVHHRHACIVCGHCVGVCKSHALTHEDFPEEKIHAINKELLPSPESMLLLCHSRRSNRSFSSHQVPKEYVDMILEAAHTAPTASNTQNVSFTIVTSREHLDYIRNYTIEGYGKLYRMLSLPVVKQLVKWLYPDLYAVRKKMSRVLKENRKGRDIILRNATAVLLIHTPSDSRFGRDDANLAYQNASLMAESLGVSQFYCGFVCSVLRRDKKRSFERHFNIDGNVQAMMAFGMPTVRFHSYMDKKEMKVKFF